MQENKILKIKGIKLPWHIFKIGFICTNAAYTLRFEISSPTSLILLNLKYKVVNELSWYTTSGIWNEQNSLINLGINSWQKYFSPHEFKIGGTNRSWKNRREMNCFQFIGTYRWQVIFKTEIIFSSPPTNYSELGLSIQRFEIDISTDLHVLDYEELKKKKNT